MLSSQSFYRLVRQCASRYPQAIIGSFPLRSGRSVQYANCTILLGHGPTRRLSGIFGGRFHFASSETLNSDMPKGNMAFSCLFGSYPGW